MKNKNIFLAIAYSFTLVIPTIVTNATKNQTNFSKNPNHQIGKNIEQNNKNDEKYVLYDASIFSENKNNIKLNIPIKIHRKINIDQPKHNQNIIDLDKILDNSNQNNEKKYELENLKNLEDLVNKLKTIKTVQDKKKYEFTNLKLNFFIPKKIVNIIEKRYRKRKKGEKLNQFDSLSVRNLELEKALLNNSYKIFNYDKKNKKSHIIVKCNIEKATLTGSLIKKIMKRYNKTQKQYKDNKIILNNEEVYKTNDKNEKLFKKPLNNNSNKQNKKNHKLTKDQQKTIIKEIIKNINFSKIAKNIKNIKDDEDCTIKNKKTFLLRIDGEIAKIIAKKILMNIYKKDVIITDEENKKMESKENYKIENIINSDPKLIKILALLENDGKLNKDYYQCIGYQYEPSITLKGKEIKEIIKELQPRQKTILNKPIIQKNNLKYYCKKEHIPKYDLTNNVKLKNQNINEQNN